MCNEQNRYFICDTRDMTVSYPTKEQVKAILSFKAYMYASQVLIDTERKLVADNGLKAYKTVPVDLQQRTV